MLKSRGLVVPLVGMLVVGLVTLGVWSTAPVLAVGKPSLVQSLIQSGKATPFSGISLNDGGDELVLYILFTVILVTTFIVVAQGIDPEYIMPSSSPGIDLTIFDH